MLDLLTAGTLSIDELLIAAFEKHKDNTALVISGDNVTYAKLEQSCLKILKHLPNKSRVGILCSRSESCYAGILATVLAGSTYVPLNKRFPADRLQSILEQTDSDVIVADDACVKELKSLLELNRNLSVIFLDDQEEVKALQQEFPDARWLIAGQALFSAPPVETTLADDLYILFTSGTTGKPKGIIVSHGNITAYLKAMFKEFDINETDIATQLFDASFDVSVHDIFVTLLIGATLVVIPEEDVLAPAKHVKEHGITLWFSVPSVPMFMDKFRMLKEYAFPSIRISMFAGEALPIATAEKWKQAVPNSRICNMYGPTETTIVASKFEYSVVGKQQDYLSGIVPIGDAFEDYTFLIVNDEGVIDNNQTGELYIGGPQVTTGYLGNKELTDSKYVTLEGYGDEIFYKSGDLVRQTKYGFEFLSRIDDQIQLRGFRVELAEIDKVIRKAVGHDLAISVPIGLKGGRAEELFAAVQGESDRGLRKEILGRCKELLPDYMAPSKVKFIDSIPLNINGKLDRNALIKLFDEE